MRCFDDTTTPRHVRKRDVMKSPVQENCTPGSVRGALGNQRPYLAKMGNVTKMNLGAKLKGGKAQRKNAKSLGAKSLEESSLVPRCFQWNESRGQARKLR